MVNGEGALAINRVLYVKEEETRVHYLGRANHGAAKYVSFALSTSSQLSPPLLLFYLSIRKTTSYMYTHDGLMSRSCHSNLLSLIPF